MRVTSIATMATAFVLMAAPQINAAPESGLATARQTYLAAINSSEPDTLINAVTADFVFIAPDRPRLDGQVQLRHWARRHFRTTQALWEKTTSDMIVSGDWAFETYDYRVVDTPRTGGSATIGIGSGISVYHRDDDNVWRIARDAWTPREQWTVFETGCEFTRLMTGPC